MTQVIGFTQHGTQYTVLTKSRGAYYAYIFTPIAGGKYTLQITPDLDNIADITPLANTTMIWVANKLYLRGEHNTEIYDKLTRKFTPPLAQNVALPQRTVLIINGTADKILPFIARDRTIAYADEWSGLPSSIPEDVIVMNNKKFPISDICMRLPSRTIPVVITAENIKGEAYAETFTR